MARRKSQPRPAFRVTQLEDRLTPAALTVLIPDAATADLAATRDLATAVAARTGQPAPTESSVATYNAAANTLTAPVAATNSVVFDWADAPNTADAVKAAGVKLADYLRTRLPVQGTIDIHFIGHGSGAVAAVEAIKALAADDAKVGKLQLTSLNATAPDGYWIDPPVPLPPEPVPLPVPPEPVRPDGTYPDSILPYPYPDPYPYPQPQPTIRALAVPYTVDLADNYFLTAGTPGLRLSGTAVGTEIDLTATTAGWQTTGTDHAEVRDWYLWTVDLTGETAYTAAGLEAQRPAFVAAGTGRAAAFALTLDLNVDGATDDLGSGANVGFGQSIQTLFAGDTGTFQGLDLAFVIDTTGSMGDDIDAVKARAAEILTQLSQQYTDVRVGLVLYRDFPDGSHGDANDYQAKVEIGFTTDLAAVGAAIQAIEVNGGADWPESVYSGLKFATDPNANLGAWRDGEVRRSIILMGDAPPQMVEPGTDYTKTSAVLRATAADVHVSTVATTASQEAYWLFKAVADLTGGNFYFTGPELPPDGAWGDGGYASGGIDLIGGYPMPVSGPGIPPSPPAAPPPGGYAAAAAESVLAAVRDLGGVTDPTVPPITVPPPTTVPPPRPIPVPDDMIRPPVFVPAEPGGRDVTVVDVTTGKSTGLVQAFPFDVPGGVRSAGADFNDDGVEDLIVGTGPGSAPRVRVIDGKTGAELFAISPFEDAFTGGVYVTAGDVTGDNIPDVIITPDEGGGPRVRVFDGKLGFAAVADFFGIDDPAFRGGARATVGDVNGDGTGDLVVAAGFQGGPRVAGYSGKSVGFDRPLARVFADFYAFEETLRNGVFVAAGDMDGDGCAEVITGGGPGGGPRVTAFNGAGLTKDRQEIVANFFAGDEADRGGVSVSVNDLDGDARADVVAMVAGRVTGYRGSQTPADGLPPLALDFARPLSV